MIFMISFVVNKLSLMKEHYIELLIEFFSNKSMLIVRKIIWLGELIYAYKDTGNSSYSYIM